MILENDSLVLDESELVQSQQAWMEGVSHYTQVCAVPKVSKSRARSLLNTSKTSHHAQVSTGARISWIWPSLWEAFSGAWRFYSRVSCNVSPGLHKFGVSWSRPGVSWPLDNTWRKNHNFLLRTQFPMILDSMEILLKGLPNPTKNKAFKPLIG